MFKTEVGESILRRELTTGKQYTAYEVEVETPFGRTRAFRRYSEFLGLHKALKKRDLPGYPANLFPRKKLLGSRSDKTITARKAAFAAWLDAVLALPNILFYVELRTFLNINMLARSEQAESILRSQRQAETSNANSNSNSNSNPDGASSSTGGGEGGEGRGRTGTLSIDELMVMFAINDSDFLHPDHPHPPSDNPTSDNPSASNPSASSSSTPPPPTPPEDGVVEHEHEEKEIDAAELDETIRTLVGAMGSELAGDLYDPCVVCRQPVADAFGIRVGGRLYHPEHLACCECRQSAQDNPSTTFHPASISAAACAPCFVAKYAPTCDVCTQAITDDVFISSAILPDASRFHTACYACGIPECGALLGHGNEFVSPTVADPPPNPSHLRCKLHFFTDLNLICSVCATPMESRVVRPPGGEPRHPECFACHFCKQPISGPFDTQDDEYYCQPCHLKLF